MMPDMNFPRCQPGLFVTPNKRYLYAFGGEDNSFERLDLKFENEWEKLKIKLPLKVAEEIGFVFYPLWNHHLETK